MTHKQNLMEKLKSYAKKTVTEAKANEIVDYAEQCYDNLQESKEYDEITIENDLFITVSRNYPEIFIKDIIKSLNGVNLWQHK